MTEKAQFLGLIRRHCLMELGGSHIGWEEIVGEA